MLSDMHIVASSGTHANTPPVWNFQQNGPTCCIIFVVLLKKKLSEAFEFIEI